MDDAEAGPHPAGGPPDLDGVLASLLALAVEACGARCGFFMLREGRRIAAYTPNLTLEKIERDILLPLNALVERTLESRRTVCEQDLPRNPAAAQRPPVFDLHVRSVAFVPLRGPEMPLGMLYVESQAVRGAHFSGARQKLLESFADQAAIAIETAAIFARERERLERAASLQAFQDHLLEAVAGGIVTIDADGRLSSFNRAAEKTFGCVAETLVGKDASVLADLIPELPDLLQTFADSGSVHLRAEVAAGGHDGRPLELELRIAPLGEAVGGAAVVFRDVTAQRALEVAHAAEIERARTIQQSFSRYLAPHIVQSLMADPHAIRLGGQRQRATMLFADVSGFTSIAANLPAERVVEVLNAWFEEAVRVVFEYDGLLDKFYGDGLMAVFGQPRAREDDAARAVAAAVRLHDVIRNLTPRLPYRLRISIGLATGDVVAGHIGSTVRMDYTVIGDAVNLASGLQTAAPPGSIYCDAETYGRARDVIRTATPVPVRLKHRAHNLTAYEIT